MNKISYLLLIVAVALTLGGCNNLSGTTDRRKPIVTVSIEPQRWLMERIVGERMAVKTLLSTGGNPESYEPAFSHLASLEKSACYLTVGNLGFEAAVLERVRSNNPSLVVINSSESVELIDDDHVHDHGVDPHVWNSPRNARIIAANMLEAAVAIDSVNQEEYRLNFRRLIETIDSVDSVCGAILAPYVGESFIVMHPSFTYFARDYGMRQISVGAEGKEHSVTDTREIIDAMEANGARVFLIDKDFNSVEVLTGRFRVSKVNPLSYEWDAELIKTARAIAGEQ